VKVKVSYVTISIEIELFCLVSELETGPLLTTIRAY